jgi:integrase
VYEDGYVALTPLKYLADTYRVSMLAIHLLRKMRGDDVLDEITGSIGLTGVVNGALILKRERVQHEATLLVTGRDIEQEQQFALRFDPLTAMRTLVGSAEEVSRTEERQEIQDLLTEQFPEGMSARQVAETLDKNYHTTRCLLRKMEAAGDICHVNNHYGAIAGENSRNQQHHCNQTEPSALLAKLTVQHVQKFYAQMLQKGLSPQTVRLLHAMLHKAFDYAVRVDLLPRNICDHVSLRRIEKRETRALSLEQALRLLETARGHRMEALFVLALVTGMRRGEIIALKWSDVNLADGVVSDQRSLVELKGGIIESKPKSSRGYRSIILPPFALEALKKHRERQEFMRQGALKWQENDYVFCTSHGTPFAATNLRTEFKALLRKAGLPDIRFHDMRHSVATLLLELGTYPKIVQELLGHANIGMTTDIYSHVMPTMQKEAMAKLDALLGCSLQKDAGGTDSGEGGEEEHT